MLLLRMAGGSPLDRNMTLDTKTLGFEKVTPLIRFLRFLAFED